MFQVDEYDYDKNKIINLLHTQSYCSSNICGNYNTCWTCPPNAPDERYFEKEISKHSKCKVIKFCADKDRNGFDNVNYGRKINDYMRKLRSENPGSLVFGIGRCNNCEECSYEKKEKCSLEKERIYSVSVTGINMMKIIEDVKVNDSCEDKIELWGIIFL